MIRILTIIILYVIGTIISYSQIKSENIVIKNDSIILPGTLTYNEKTTQPLVIFIPGSGNPDRNGNQPIYNVKSFDPKDEIKKLTIPILIINGTKDSQVLVEDAKALHKANPNSKLVIIKNMNHILKYIEKESDHLKSYIKSDFPIS